MEKYDLETGSIATGVPCVVWIAAKYDGRSPLRDGPSVNFFRVVRPVKFSPLALVQQGNQGEQKFYSPFFITFD